MLLNTRALGYFNTLIRDKIGLGKVKLLILT